MTVMPREPANNSAQGHTLRRYSCGHCVRELGEELIGATVGDLGHGPFVSRVGLVAYGGAIADISDDATASAIATRGSSSPPGFRSTDPAQDEARLAVTRAHGAALEQFASGAYVNDLGDERAGGVRRAYSPKKLARLADVRSTSDPDNVLRLTAFLAEAATA